MVEAKEPAWPSKSRLMNVPFVQPWLLASAGMDPRAPKAASKIGSRTCPDRPRFWKTVHAGSLIDGQVVLRIDELGQEAILKDVHLLDPVQVPLVGALIAHVAHLEHRVLGNLALNAQTPALHIRIPHGREFTRPVSLAGRGADVVTLKRELVLGEGRSKSLRRHRNGGS